MSCKNMRRDEYELEKGNNEVHRHDGEEHRLTGNTVVTTWDSLSIRLFPGVSNRKILRALPGLERKPGAQVAVDPTSQPAAQQDPRRPHPVVPLHILGSSGIKFEVEGGEGSPGADIYIPPPKKLQSCFIFHRNLRFCSIF